MNTCMSGWYYYSAAPIGFLKSASFSERGLPVSGFLSLPFLTRFPHMRCHIQGQGFGNKMYISGLFTVVGYLHTAGFKNRWGINFAKCIYLCAKEMLWHMHMRWPGDCIDVTAKFNLKSSRLGYIIWCFLSFFI